MCAVSIIFVLAAILPLSIGFSLSACVLARSFQQKLKQTPKCQERVKYSCKTPAIILFCIVRNEVNSFSWTAGCSSCHVTCVSLVLFSFSLPRHVITVTGVWHEYGMD